jgi:hypothetical protein
MDKKEVKKEGGAKGYRCGLIGACNDNYTGAGIERESENSMKKQGFGRRFSAEVKKL